MGQLSPLLGEINTILSYIYDGCETPSGVIIETATPVAGEIAVALLSFGWEDIVKSFWRPKGLRGNRHGRKRRKGKNGGGIPGINDMIADKFDPQGDWFKDFRKDGNRIYWELENRVERFNYTIMILEMIETFAYKTCIGIINLPTTNCAIQGRGFLRGSEYDAFNNGQWYVLPLQHEVYVQWPVYKNFYTLFMDDDKDYQIMTTCTGHNNGDTNGELTMQVQIAAAVGGGIYEKHVPSIEPGGSDTQIFTAVVKGPGYVQLYQRSHGDIQFTYTSVQIFPSFLGA